MFDSAIILHVQYASDIILFFMSVVLQTTHVV